MGEWGDGHDKSAVLSNCGTYRYTLHRSWGRLSTMTFIMLNPSTADGTVDDPTIRRCTGFARREGCEQLVVANLFAYRATSPKELFAAEDPEGPDNDVWLRFCLRRKHGLIVFAWGAHGAFRGADERVRSMARELGIRPYHIGLTKKGQPKHPLYLRADARLQEFC